MPKRGFQAPDDQPLVVLKRDLGGGMNNRQNAQMIEDNQAVLLQNILLETAGQTSVRTGQTQIDSGYPNNQYVYDDSGNSLKDDSSDLVAYF